jgi:hypothetical protein
MLEETPEREEIIERIAALDIGKAELVCCVRAPGGPGKSRRMPEVQTYKTMTRSLLVMIERLRELGGNPGDHGGNVRILETTFLPPRSGWVRNLAAQRERRQTPTGSSQNRQTRFSVVAGQGSRAADDPAQFRATATDPDAAGSDPLPLRSGGGPARDVLDERARAQRSEWRAPHGGAGARGRGGAGATDGGDSVAQFDDQPFGALAPDARNTGQGALSGAPKRSRTIQ